MDDCEDGRGVSSTKGLEMMVMLMLKLIMMTMMVMMMMVMVMAMMSEESVPPRG